MRVLLESDQVIFLMFKVDSFHLLSLPLHLFVLVIGKYESPDKYINLVAFPTSRTTLCPRFPIPSPSNLCQYTLLQHRIPYFVWVIQQKKSLRHPLSTQHQSLFRITNHLKSIDDALTLYL